MDWINKYKINNTRKSTQSKTEYNINICEEKNLFPYHHQRLQIRKYLIYINREFTNHEELKRNLKEILICFTILLLSSAKNNSNMERSPHDNLNMNKYDFLKIFESYHNGISWLLELKKTRTALQTFSQMALY